MIKQALVLPLEAIIRGLSCQEKAHLKCLMTSWLVFILATAVYSFFGVWLKHGLSASHFSGTLHCVSRDWAIWLLVTPLFYLRISRLRLDWNSHYKTIISMMMACIVVAMICRLSLEMWLGSSSLIKIFHYYLPRYLFAAVIVAGVIMLFKRNGDIGIQTEQHSGPATGNKAYVKQLVVAKGNQRALVNTDDIISVTACGNYLEIDSLTGCYLLRSTLKQIEKQLNPEEFIRVHRSHIVRLHSIQSACKRKYQARIENGNVIRIGRQYAKNLPHFM